LRSRHTPATRLFFSHSTFASQPVIDWHLSPGHELYVSFDVSFHVSFDVSFHVSSDMPWLLLRLRSGKLSGAVQLQVCVTDAECTVNWLALVVKSCAMNVMFCRLVTAPPKTNVCVVPAALLKVNVSVARHHVMRNCSGTPNSGVIALVLSSPPVVSERRA
jgi:hypothetical protein